MPSKKTQDSIEFRDRDFALLRCLFESRLMSSAHIAKLFFNGQPEATKKRLQKLKAAGVLRERPGRRRYEAAVYHFTRKGFDVLRGEGEFNGYPEFNWPRLAGRAYVKPNTLRHELSVMDVKSALTPAINSKAGFEVAEFSTWPLLYAFRAKRRYEDGSRKEVPVEPDGLLRIEESVGEKVYTYNYFLEVDCTSEKQETLAGKAMDYADYYMRGGFAIRNGRPATDFEKVPFRVLMILESDERRNNAAAIMLLSEPPTRTRVWLTTRKEILRDPLGPIWVRPIDYKEALTGTLFKLERPSKKYKRQPERERSVAQRIKKHALLCEPEEEKSDPIAGSLLS